MDLLRDMKGGGLTFIADDIYDGYTGLPQKNINHSIHYGKIADRQAQFWQKFVWVIKTLF